MTCDLFQYYLSYIMQTYTALVVYYHGKTVLSTCAYRLYNMICIYTAFNSKRTTCKQNHVIVRESHWYYISHQGCIVYERIENLL